MNKKIACAVFAVLSVLLLASPVLAFPAAPIPTPEGTDTPRDWDGLIGQDGELLPSAVVADAAILMDSRTGKVLFEKEADARNFPASITKIMTCLVALSSGKDLNETITIGKLPAMESGAETIDLKQGETVTLEQLLYGLMLMSGNDAANAIAVAVSGSVDEFVSLMNSKAQEIGMTGTHYMNTNGLNNPDHYTTARDMAILTQAAQKYAEFEKIVSTVRYTMPPTNKHEKERAWTNHNLLIVPKEGNDYFYQYATGIKTGYTSKAESTLVSSAQKEDAKLIAVVLHDEKYPKWTDSITLFEYGFNYYATIDLVQLLVHREISVDVKNAAPDDSGQGKLSVSLVPRVSAAFITDRKKQIEELQSNPSRIPQAITLLKDIAPISRNDVIGSASFTYDGLPALVFDLKATRDIHAARSPAAIRKPGSWALWLFALVLVPLIIVFSFRIYNSQRRKKNRKGTDRRARARR